MGTVRTSAQTIRLIDRRGKCFHIALCQSAARNAFAVGSAVVEQPCIVNLYCVLRTLFLWRCCRCRLCVLPVCVLMSHCSSNSPGKAVRDLHKAAASLSLALHSPRTVAKSKNPIIFFVLHLNKFSPPLNCKNILLSFTRTKRLN